MFCAPRDFASELRTTRRVSLWVTKADGTAQTVVAEEAVSGAGAVSAGLPVHWTNVHDGRGESPAFQVLAPSSPAEDEGDGDDAAAALVVPISFVAPALVLQAAPLDEDDEVEEEDFDVDDDDDDNDKEEGNRRSVAAAAKPAPAAAGNLSLQSYVLPRATAVAISASGDRVAMGAETGGLRLVHLPSASSSAAAASATSPQGPPSVTFRGHVADVTQIQWFPSDAVCLSSSVDLGAMVWDGRAPGPSPAASHRLRAETRAPAATIRGHVGGVLGTALVRRGRGKVIATASRDGTVRLWRVAGGECLLTLRVGCAVHAIALVEPAAAGTAAAEASATAAASSGLPSPTDLLLAACDDGRVRVYAIGAAGMPLVASEPLPGAAHAFTLDVVELPAAPTPAVLVMAGGDAGTAAVWDAAPALVAAAAAAAGGPSLNSSSSSLSSPASLPLLWHGRIGQADCTSDVTRVRLVSLAGLVGADTAGAGASSAGRLPPPPPLALLRCVVAFADGMCCAVALQAGRKSPQLLASFTGPGSAGVRDVDVWVGGRAGGAGTRGEGGAEAEADALPPIPAILVATAANDGYVRLYRLPTQVSAHLCVVEG
jgi:hypothetical protein